jgi:phosphate transport system substrate-binding protein
MRRRFLIVVAVVVLVGTVAIPAAPVYAASAITGGGSSFAALEIDQWRADTARNPYGLSVNYVSQGSTFGRQGFIEGQLDFGASDIQFLPQELPSLQSRRCGGRDPSSPGACFVYVPVSAGGLAFMYNLTDGAGNRVTNLNLTRTTACKVFTGAIQRWNDPEIVQSNPSLASFNRDIIPVIRADGAGESYVFSQFCIAVAPAIWQAFVADRVAHDPANVASDFRAGQPVSNWPQAWGHSQALPYADGTANQVADPVAGKDTITYVAAGYAKVRSFPTASLQNAAGVFTQPDEDNVTVALSYATGRPDGTFILNFTGPDRRAYFPSTYSYVLAQTAGFDPGKGAALGRFLCYSVSQGQVIAPQLRYARLSQPLVDIAETAISKIPGAPPRSSCFIGSSKPPPLPGGVTINVAGAGGAKASTAAQAEAQAAAQAQAQAAAQQKALEAAKRKAAAERRKKASIDKALRNAAAASATKSGSSSTDAIWLILAGVFLAAAGSLALDVRRRSAR